MKATLAELIVDLAEDALQQQDPRTGAMPPGHNGPYNDPESPVRNSSHWAITFSKLWNITGQAKYADAAQRCLNFLVQAHESCRKGTLPHRTAAGKDSCNGLVGPAWNIEALVEGWLAFADRRYLKLAEHLFLVHPFNSQFAGWHRVEPDGAVLTVDPTFNHQVWFAASAMPLAVAGADPRCRDLPYLARSLMRRYLTAADGRIFHFLRHPRFLFPETARRALRPSYRKKMYVKELGYQTFNLYALLRLAQTEACSSLSLFNRTRKAIKLLSRPCYHAALVDNPFAYGYNAPGFELPFIEYAAGEASLAGGSGAWLERQLHYTYDPQRRQFSRGTSDPVLLTARIYELCRLPRKYFDLDLVIGEK